MNKRIKDLLIESVEMQLDVEVLQARKIGEEMTFKAIDIESNKAITLATDLKPNEVHLLDNEMIFEIRQNGKVIDRIIIVP